MKSLSLKQLGTLWLLSTSTLLAAPWQDAGLSVEQRVDDLLSRMTLEEKIQQCSSDIPAIDRLGIPAYMWYGEALHGVISWQCTAFPQNIAMGCTWNPDLMLEVATAISDEARALKNAGQKEVMMFSPTVNMARDPRWGRNEECYSEDPYLMSEIARMYVRGMQGTDPKYLKTVCTVKHFVANNVDSGRERIHSQIGERDLREYYFPAFKACVVDEKAAGIMTALNGLNGIPCSGHDWLVNKVLRDEWGFEGYVIADWNAASGMYKNMKYVKSFAEASALAIKSGVDQECFRPKASPMVKHMKEAIDKGYLTEEELDVSVKRLLRLRFLTGDFDPPEMNPYSDIPTSVLECEEHRALARKAAQQSMVLLKNEKQLLPLKRDLDKVAVIGPFADRCWLGIYSGHPRNTVTPLAGIKAAVDADVVYAKGCGITEPRDEAQFKEAVAIAKGADVAIVVLGNDETTATENVDRKSLNLPGAQQQLLEEIYKVNSNVVLVLVPSGATAVGWAQDHVPAILCMWPNGQEQGHALADVLFGKVNPGGKLCSTWFRSDSDLPDIHDYNIHNNRTYMYFTGQPLYPFGYGLSYTTFEYGNLQVDRKQIAEGETLKLRFNVANTGSVEGDEIVQLYIKDKVSSVPMPKKALKGFKRIHLARGEQKTVEMELPYEALSFWDERSNRFIVEAGEFELMVGASAEDFRLNMTVSAARGVIPERNVKSVGVPLKKRAVAKSYRSKQREKTITGKTDVKQHNWVEYAYTFTDPGFYVNSWKAEIRISSAAKNSRIKFSMLGMDIEEVDVPSVSNQGQPLVIPVSIPIPPEYGKEFKLRITELAGNVDVDSIIIYPPESQKPDTLNVPSAQSK